MFSIDQNCHSLWDVLPKLQALAGRGLQPTQFVEDIDVAFTSLGSAPDAGELKLDRERYHHSGGAYWGAALFYSEFLGRLPADPRDWEPYTGMKTHVLTKRLGRSPEDLFEEFSASDNWQLIGPSYVGDADHHRVIGDLSVAETAPFLREIMDKAAADMLRAFPEVGSRQRLTRWLRAEGRLLEELLTAHAGARLPDLYLGWLGRRVGGAARLDKASTAFAWGAGAGRTALLEVFLNDYDLAAGLYNESIAETRSRLRPLRTGQGELPFFAVLDHLGHHARTGVFLAGREVRVGRRCFKLAAGNRLPVEELAAAGVRCLAGKAILLVIQLRLGSAGRPLALPYQGSTYMPAAHRLAEKLARHDLLGGRLHPIVRVRFRLLDRLGALPTRIRLPGHLAPYFGAEEVPAAALAEHHASAAADADERLESFRDDAARRRWQERSFPKLTRAIADLDRRRRDLAARPHTPEEIRGLWKQAKALQVELLEKTLRQIAGDFQVRQLDYWDSRGAIWPWCVALGGRDFYNKVIQEAEVYDEPP